MFDKAESKNKLLRSVAGGGVDTLGQLPARWDKFELMMESHKLMIKEQVISLLLFEWQNSIYIYRISHDFTFYIKLYEMCTCIGNVV